MAKCDICGKGMTFGIQVSHSHRRSNRTWKPNVRRIKAIVNGTPRHINVCSRCLRSGKVTRAIQVNTKNPFALRKGIFCFCAAALWQTLRGDRPLQGEPATAWNCSFSTV